MPIDLTRRSRAGAKGGDARKVKRAVQATLEAEGAGRSYAGDSAHAMADLYGYAAMLHAATQQQQQQIDRLTREVETLREQCR